MFGQDGAAAGGQTAEQEAADPAVDYDPPPASQDAMREAITAGRPVMWCEHPVLDGSVHARRDLLVRGWAYAPDGIDRVVIMLDDSEPFVVQPNQPRLDVARALSRADAEESGFLINLDLREVEPGTHRLRLVAHGRHGRVGCEGDIVVLPRQPGDELAVPAREPTGERLVPDVAETRLVRAEHEGRYRIAAELARGREVLDAGCGVGYGSVILSRTGAASVVGIDRSPEAVLDARSRAGDVAEFLLGDLEELPFEDGRFGLICCFEAIEHVLAQQKALDELRRVVAATGILVLSCPNPDAYTQGNPWHVSELRPSELRTELERRFANVALLGQHAQLASLIADPVVFDIDDPARTIEASVRKLARAEHFLYTVVAASDAPLPDLGTMVVLSDIYEHREMTELVHGFEERAIVAEADAQASRVECGIARLAADRADARAEEAERARQVALAQLEVVRRSRSWRLTAALRALRGRVR